MYGERLFWRPKYDFSEIIPFFSAFLIEMDLDNADSKKA